MRCRGTRKIMLPGDSKVRIVNHILRMVIPMIQTTKAKAEGEGREWWRMDWAVRKGYGVDILWAMKILLEITIGVFKDWETKGDGAARGRTRPNRKYYRTFGRLLTLQGDLQEMIFRVAEFAKVGKTRRI